MRAYSIWGANLRTFNGSAHLSTYFGIFNILRLFYNLTKDSFHRFRSCVSIMLYEVRTPFPHKFLPKSTRTWTFFQFAHSLLVCVCVNQRNPSAPPNNNNNEHWTRRPSPWANFHRVSRLNYHFHLMSDSILITSRLFLTVKRTLWTTIVPTECIYQTNKSFYLLLRSTFSPLQRKY